MSRLKSILSSVAPRNVVLVLVDSPRASSTIDAFKFRLPGRLAPNPPPTTPDTHPTITDSMAGSGDLIDFNVIEGHKENIQALPSGRSAKALAQLYSPPLLGANPSPSLIQDANSKERQAFEKELALIDEADDPLDVYDRYVKWTLDAYPSAQSTPQSGLLPLLERATKTFQSSPHYKNDPRYLKIWLHYIRLFSDAPREVFVFLSRNSIGDGLALYYEEFAAWLENAGRWSQAEEVYKMGMEKEARPVERLIRKSGEFERRKDARPEDVDEPKSPALPTVRPALAAKTDPFASSDSPAQQQQANSTAPKKGKSSKMQIFADGDEADRPSSGASSKGWDNIGTLAERKKENTHAAKPMAGEKLKVGKTNGGVQKMMVFKDTVSLSPKPSLAAIRAQDVYKNRTKLFPRMQSSNKAFLPKHLARSTSGKVDNYQWAKNPRNGRLECVFVNLEAVYPRSGSEYSFEELRARHRGWKDYEWPRERREPVAKPAGTPALDIELENAPEQDEPTEPAGKGFKIHRDEPEPAPKQKQRGFKIFEDKAPEPGPSSKPSRQNEVFVETSSKTLALNDENDENAPPSQPSEAEIRKKMRKEERANRTRKISVMDKKHIKGETKTIQLNMDSPTGQKPKRKKNGEKAEPTMTINTKEAMDEIYGIFNAPLPAQGEQSESESEDSDSDDEDDYTTGDESTATGTGKMSAPPSDYGDETRRELLEQAPAEDDAEDDRTEHTGWSDFTTSKHVPKESEGAESGPASGDMPDWDLQRNPHGEEPEEDMITPEAENVQTRSIPIASEDYEPPSAQFQQMSMLPNHRLPFMTPIAEQTESSLGTITARAQKDYFNAKTPSRQTPSSMPQPDEEDDEIPSSPFDEVTVALNDDKFKVLQPIRTKSTKGNISLGKGTATSQIEAQVIAPSAPEAVQTGPIVLEKQCNPMDPYLRQTILTQIRPSLGSFEGYHEHADVASGRTAEIKKYIKSLAKANKNSANGEKTGQTLSLPPMLKFEGSDATYTIKREVGAGTFAPVYLVENSAASQALEDAQDENGPSARGVGKLTHRKPLEAVKMEEPLSAWEFFILQQSHRRLGVSRAAESIVRAHEMHMFQDECFLVEEYRNQGTLLDLVNIARADSSASTSGGGMDEVLAMWLTVELFRTVESLHSKQIIHGDLKGDNVLVRFDDPGEETDWSGTYFPSGAHGWSSKGICLIDFGRGIDLKQFVPGVAFIADWKTTEADCAEMRELRPWTYQVDYHGLAGIVHSMLFGKYMETIADRGASLGQGASKTYRIRENLKRYWQVEIWQEVFNLLLNPLANLAGEEGAKMPVLNGMRGLRVKMEGWLEENCERGMGLKGMIGRMETITKEKRRRSGRA